MPISARSPAPYSYRPQGRSTIRKFHPLVTEKPSVVGGSFATAGDGQIVTRLEKGYRGVTASFGQRNDGAGLIASKCWHGP